MYVGNKIEIFLKVLEFQNLRRHTVYHITGRKNCIPPKGFRYIGGEHYGTGYFKKMTIFPFRNPILLRTATIRTLVYDPVLLQIFAQNCIKVFTSIIDTKNLYF